MENSPSFHHQEPQTDTNCGIWRETLQASEPPFCIPLNPEGVSIEARYLPEELRDSRFGVGLTSADEAVFSLVNELDDIDQEKLEDLQNSSGKSLVEFGQDVVDLAGEQLVEKMSLNENDIDRLNYRIMLSNLNWFIFEDESPRLIKWLRREDGSYDVSSVDLDKLFNQNTGGLQELIRDRHRKYAKAQFAHQLMNSFQKEVKIHETDPEELIPSFILDINYKSGSSYEIQQEIDTLMQLTMRLKSIDTRALVPGGSGTRLSRLREEIIGKRNSDNMSPKDYLSHMQVCSAVDDETKQLAAIQLVLLDGWALGASREDAESIETTSQPHVYFIRTNQEENIKARLEQSTRFANALKLIADDRYNLDDLASEFPEIYEPWQKLADSISNRPYNGKLQDVIDDLARLASARDGFTLEDLRSQLAEKLWHKLPCGESFRYRGTEKENGLSVSEYDGKKSVYSNGTDLESLLLLQSLKQAKCNMPRNSESCSNLQHEIIEGGNRKVEQEEKYIEENRQFYIKAAELQAELGLSDFELQIIKQATKKDNPSSIHSPSVRVYDYAVLFNALLLHKEGQNITTKSIRNFIKTQLSNETNYGDFLKSLGIQTDLDSE